MEMLNMSNLKEYLPQVGDVYFFDNRDNNSYGVRPVIILKVFKTERRILIAPLSTSISKFNNNDILIKNPEGSFLKKDSIIKLAFIKTCDVQDLRINIGRVSGPMLIEIYNILGVEINIINNKINQEENSKDIIMQDNLEKHPKIIVCGPHGNGKGIEMLRGLANQITKQGKYVGQVLIDTPERPDLTLKRKFQSYALLSRGVIVYFSDKYSGACNEYDWASELDIFTVGIVSNHIPTEMLEGIDVTKDNVKLIKQTTGNIFSYFEEAINWIDFKIEDRIKRLSKY